MAIELPDDVRAALEKYARGDSDSAVLIEQAVGVAQFAIDRVLAHQQDSSRFPLAGDADTFEQVLLRSIRRLPADRVRMLASRARSRLESEVSQRDRWYGFAASLDPTSREPVCKAVLGASVSDDLRARVVRVQQKASIKRPPPSAHEPRRPVPTTITHAGSGHASGAAPTRTGRPKTASYGGAKPGPRGPAPSKPRSEALVPAKLRLFVHEVHVIDKTNELSRDDMEIGAVLFDPLGGQSIHVPPVALGKFRRNDRKNTFKPIVLREIDLQDGAIVPQFVFGNMFLGEIDRKTGGGSFAKYVAENGILANDEIVRGLNDLQVAAFFTLNGAAIGSVGLASLASSTGAALGLGLLGLAGGLIVGAVVGVAVVLLFRDVFAALGSDEIFDVQPIGQVVDPDGDLGMANTQTVTFVRPRAAYSVTFKWDVVFGLGQPPPPPPRPFGVLPEIDDNVALTNLQTKVDHIVVLMLENRSFDQMLGYLTAVRGRSEVNGLRGNEFNINPKTGQRIVVHALADTVFELDPPHDADQTRVQISGDPPIGGFVEAFVNDPFFDPRKHRPEDIMGYHRPEQVPVFDFIASQFAICNRWHAAFAGNTWINRTIAITGQPARDKDGTLFVGNEMPITHGRTAEVFFRRIDEFNATRRKGEDLVDWRSYALDFSSAFIVDPDYVPISSPRLRSMDRFLEDLESGTLPQVSWLDPNYVDFGPSSNITAGDHGGFLKNIRFPQTANDDHPPTDVAHGQALVATLVFAMMQSRLWEKILFIITYDEHGGFFDHVPPPVNPDSEGALFDIFGLRVPALVISPWVEAGAVSTRRFNHSSIIKTILTRFCLRDGRIPNVSRRVDNALHLGHVLTANQPRFVAAAGRAARSKQPVRQPVKTVGGIAGAPTAGAPRALRDGVLRALGRRFLVEEARPRPQTKRPLTDLERDIENVRALLRSQGIRGAGARR